MNKKRISQLMRAIIICIVFVLMLPTTIAILTSASDTDVMYGDVDASMNINANDALNVLKYAAQIESFTENQKKIADVNGDKRIDAADALLILKYAAKMIDRFPVEEIIASPGDIMPTDTEILPTVSSESTVMPTITPEIVVTPTGTTETVTVIFKDYDGTVLSTQKVGEGASASIPENPTKSGVSFMGWSGNFINVEQNENVRAVYSDENNVFVVQSTTGSVGDTVKVLVAVDGNVKTCGFDFDMFYDPDLELVSYDNDLDLDIIVNDAVHKNGIKLNFSSASDKTKQRDIIELTFKIKDTTKKFLPIVITKLEVFEILSSGNIENASYVVVDGVVTVK